MNDTTVHVAVGVVRNTANEILIAQRPAGVHQGGKWEFPGGKVRPGETTAQALVRELHEEVGINVTVARPLIQIRHIYTDKQVWLDVWQIDSFTGSPRGCENQPVRWCPQENLAEYEFPAADRAILQAVNLPDRYLITGAFDSEAHFHARLERCLQAGITLVQFRAKTMDPTAYARMAGRVIEHCHEHAARILLNADPAVAEQLDADGVHLTSSQLMALDGRPLAQEKLVAASVHNLDQLQQANRCGVNFSVIAPVQVTRSHAGATPLGWEAFATLAGAANHPVFALGGLDTQHLTRIWQQGGQGVAAITSLWEAG